MSAKDPQMKLRLPSAIKDEIERISSDTGRSMNAEIVRRLEWVLGSGSRYYEIDGPDYPEHWRSEAEQQHLKLYGSKYKAEDFPDDQASSDGLDAVERALIRMWRAMNDGERSALVAVAERFAETDQSEDGSKRIQPDEKSGNEQVITAEEKLDAIRRLIEEIDSDICIIENELKNKPSGLSEGSFIIRQINSDLSQMRARRESYWSQMLKLIDVTGARERPHGLLSSEESAFWRRVFDAS